MEKKMNTGFRIIMLLGVLVLMSWTTRTFAGSATQSANDSTRVVSLEEVSKIAGQLMAPCCWSETADVHNSEAAQEVRAQVRSALQTGYSEKQILDGMVAAYGERILAKPKATGFNLFAWILPALALVAGGVIAWRFLAHSRMKTATQPVQKIQLDASYEERLERELREIDK